MWEFERFLEAGLVFGVREHDGRLLELQIEVVSFCANKLLHGSMGAFVRGGGFWSKLKLR